MLRNKIINKIKYNILDKYDLDSIIIKASLKNSSNFNYVVQYEKTIFENSLVIIEKDKNILILNKLEKKSIDNLEEFEIVDKEKFNLKEYLIRKNKVGIDFSSFNYYEICQYKELTRAIDISKDLLELRAIKEEEEIEFIKKANEITRKVFEEIYSINLENYDEYKLKSYLEEIGREYGGYGYSFETIVAFDENTSKPHYIPTPNKKYAKKIILIDIGVKYRNYTSDVTRFFILESNELKEKAEFLLRLQSELILKIKEGINVYDLDKHYRNKLKENGFEVYHSLGHGIGIDVHELPYISIKCNRELKNNMVFTIEPGIYDKYGLRFEDNILLKSKPVVLSNYLREIDELLL